MEVTSKPFPPIKASSFSLLPFNWFSLVNVGPFVTGHTLLKVQLELKKTSSFAVISTCWYQHQYNTGWYRLRIPNSVWLLIRSIRHIFLWRLIEQKRWQMTWVAEGTAICHNMLSLDCDELTFLERHQYRHRNSPSQLRDGSSSCRIMTRDRVVAFASWPFIQISSTLGLKPLQSNIDVEAFFWLRKSLTAWAWIWFFYERSDIIFWGEKRHFLLVQLVHILLH